MAKRYRFIVEGATHFPIDMLRYDACWPATEDDALRISSSLDRHNFEPGRVRVAVVSHNSPTKGRWESFGWHVSDVIVT